MSDYEERIYEIMLKAKGRLLAREGGCRFPPPLQAKFLEGTIPFPEWPTTQVLMS